MQSCIVVVTFWFLIYGDLVLPKGLSKDCNKDFGVSYVFHVFLSASLGRAGASGNHFFFCLWTFMNCGYEYFFLTEVMPQWAMLVLG